MLFNSFQFIYFFLLVYALYIVLQKRGQNVVLLVASYVFYGAWDWRFLSLLLISTMIDYVCGLGIAGAETQRKKRLYLLASMVTNLGLLFSFKYYNFFAGSLQELLAVLGIESDLRFTQIVLPVGISFYTFQTMSYTIDIYRGVMRPTRSFLDFALFVSFFPQLVAGPIERAVHLLPQVENRRVVTYRMVRNGAWLILLGYFKKVVLADNMAPFADDVFGNPDGVHGLYVIFGTMAFALQIYGDFSGYSDIARGTAALMGFDIMVNFRMPYFAVNPSDFWSRWHISLSTWLRDYLYIPLGGNRGGRTRTCRNLFLTMLLGGLWHGAAWNFVIWGLYHGILLAVYRQMEERRGGTAAPSGPVRLVQAMAFLPLTLFGWVLFRVERMGDVGVLLGNLFHPLEFNGKVCLLSMLVFFLPVLFVDLMQERGRDMMVVKTWSPVLRYACYAVFFMVIVLSGAIGRYAFIYFQF